MAYSFFRMYQLLQQRESSVGDSVAGLLSLCYVNLTVPNKAHLLFGLGGSNRYEGRRFSREVAEEVFNSLESGHD